MMVAKKLSLSAGMIRANLITAHSISAGVIQVGDRIYDANEDLLKVQTPDGLVQVTPFVPQSIYGDTIEYPCRYCGRDWSFNKGDHSCDGCGAPKHRVKPRIVKPTDWRPGGRLGSNPRPRRAAAK